MVDTSILTGIGNNAFTLIIIVVIAVVVAAIVAAIVIALGNLKKYKQFKIFIFEKDGAGNTIPKFDEGGVFVDKKTGNKRLYLKNAGIGLSPDNIPFMPMGKEKWVFLLRVGLKNFRYISFAFDEGLIQFKVGEEDVNWAINVYEAQKKRFAQGWLAQYLPFIIIGFTAVIFLILVIWLFNKLAVIQEIAASMLEVAKELSAARSGTVIIPK